MRGINQKFIDDLNEGILGFFLKQIKNKKEVLSLEIRNGYVNIYYRGGNLLKIKQKRLGYSFHFDVRYCLNKGDDSSFEILSTLNSSSVEDYISVFDLMMKEMDSWLDAHPKKEREYQHNLLSHNASIIDIEYQINYKNSEGKTKAMRLDMIIIDDDKMIVVENKYGEGAVRGNSGLLKHYNDICMVLETERFHSELLNSMKNISNAKFQLGLLEHPVMSLDPRKTEILFLLAEYNPNSKTIYNEMAVMNKSFPVTVLYTEATDYIIDFNESKDLFVYES